MTFISFLFTSSLFETWVMLSFFRKLFRMQMTQAPQKCPFSLIRVKAFTEGTLSSHPVFLSSRALLYMLRTMLCSRKVTGKTCRN